MDKAVLPTAVGPATTMRFFFRNNLIGRQIYSVFYPFTLFCSVSEPLPVCLGFGFKFLPNLYEKVSDATRVSLGPNQLASVKCKLLIVPLILSECKTSLKLNFKLPKSFNIFF